MKSYSAKLRAKYRYSIILLRQLVITDFKLRYQGSVLGYAWSLLRPLALFLIMYIVFGRLIKVGSTVPHYPVYLLLGIVLWNYFVEVTTGAVAAIVAKGDLIRKISFPKYVIIFAGSFSALINLMINFIVIAVLMFVNGVEVRSTIVVLPVLVVELFTFSIAVGFFLSALYVKFRDLNYIWDVILQAAFYATPILYPIGLVSASTAKILLLNPMAQIIQDARLVVVSEKTHTFGTIYNNELPRLIPMGIVVVSVILAGRFFRNKSLNFAEEV